MGAPFVESEHPRSDPGSATAPAPARRTGSRNCNTLSPRRGTARGTRRSSRTLSPPAPTSPGPCPRAARRPSSRSAPRRSRQGPPPRPGRSSPSGSRAARRGCRCRRRRGHPRADSLRPGAAAREQPSRPRHRGGARGGGAAASGKGKAKLRARGLSEGAATWCQITEGRAGESTPFAVRGKRALHAFTPPSSPVPHPNPANHGMELRSFERKTQVRPGSQTRKCSPEHLSWP